MFVVCCVVCVVCCVVCGVCVVWGVWCVVFGLCVRCVVRVVDVWCLVSGVRFGVLCVVCGVVPLRPFFACCCSLLSPVLFLVCLFSGPVWLVCVSLWSV